MQIQRMLTALKAVLLPTGTSVQFGDQAARTNPQHAVSRLSKYIDNIASGGRTRKEAQSEQVIASASTPHAIRLAYSGVYSMRGDGQANGTMLVMRCGPGYNAHTHKDAGTFELAAHGEVRTNPFMC